MVRWVSVEPLLDSIDFQSPWSAINPEYPKLGIHWVVVGGESGPGARPMHPDWVRFIRDQCLAAGVSFWSRMESISDMKEHLETLVQRRLRRVDSRSTKRPKSRPKPVVKPNQWSRGIESFRQRYGLSLSDIAGLCTSGGQFISKSSVSRLCRGDAEPRFIEKIRPAMLSSIRTFLLESKKLPLAEVENELRTIFCQQEIQAVKTQYSELSIDARRYFGLKRDPFDPKDPRTKQEEFTSRDLDKIASELEDSLRYQGFTAVLGDIGSGKSMMKRRMCETVKASSGRLRVFWPKFYNMDKVHSGSIVYFLLHEFGQRAPQDLLSRARALETILAKLSEEGTSVAIGFDECHRLHKNCIVALKNFWELGTGGYDRYLSIVLFGQNSFEFTLSEHREIQERLKIIKMPGMAKTGADYIKHRLRIAGAPAEKLFEPSAVSELLKLADTPLALGNVCNAALAKAFELNEKKVHTGVLKAAGLVDDEPRVRAARHA